MKNEPAHNATLFMNLISNQNLTFALAVWFSIGEITKMKKPLLLMCLLGLTLTVFAKPDIVLSLSASYLRAGKVLPAETQLMPGDQIVYESKAENKGDEPALQFRTPTPVPAGTEFVSAESAGTMEYSIERGDVAKLTYAAEPMMTQRQADGSYKKVPAPKSLYTAARASFTELAVSQSVTTKVTVQVKGK